MRLDTLRLVCQVGEDHAALRSQELAVNDESRSMIGIRYEGVGQGAPHSKVASRDLRDIQDTVMRINSWQSA
jgi:hypothetical protein